MTSINQKVSDIIEKHRNNTPAIIQQLFNILPPLPFNEKKFVQSAILFSMESLHEWQNIAYFVQKWQHSDFRKEFIKRMKKRIDQEPDQGKITNTKEQMTKAIDKYWQTKSPRKEENKYFDPQPSNIDHHNEDSRRSIPATDTPQFKNRQPPRSAMQVQSQPLPSQIGRKSQNYNRLQNLTGRPTILKKASFLDMKHRIQNQGKNPIDKPEPQPSKPKSTEDIPPNVPSKRQQEQKSKHSDNNSDKGSVFSDQSKPVSDHSKRISTIKLLAQMVNKPNGPNRQLIPKKVTSQDIPQVSEQIHSHPGDEPYPSEQNFKFGSSQKKEDKSQDYRRKTVSPLRKMDISNKKVVIKRQLPNDYNEKQDRNFQAKYLNDFSFMDSGTKPSSLHHPQELPKPNPPKFDQPAFSFTSQKRTKNPYLSQAQARNFIAHDSSPLTPAFELPPKAQEPTFLSKQQMKLVNPEYKPLYVYRNLMLQNGFEIGKMMRDGLDKWKNQWRPYNGKIK